MITIFRADGAIVVVANRWLNVARSAPWELNDIALQLHL